MEELQTYKKEFNALVGAVHSASLGIEPINTNRYALVLYDEIKNIPSLPLEVCDIEQELRLCWVIFVRKYNDRKPEITLRQYLLRRSIWALRDWYKHVQKPSSESHRVGRDSGKQEFPFKLDTRFLVEGSDLFPFTLLTPYQRYILYLKYKENKSISQIAKLVIKTRKTVSLELRRLLKNLRSVAKDAS